MKNLIDWMWEKKHYKSGGEDKRWATADEIPKRFRSKLGQILQFDWQKKNPYPGWVLMAVQGGSGWMCKLMKNKEACEYMRKQKRRSPKEYLRKKCINELLLPIDHLDSTMLSIWLEIGELSATHTCDLGFLDGYIKGAVTTSEAEVPRAVTPLRIGNNYTDRRPSVFVLTSTNTNTQKQWEATYQDVERI